MRRASLQLVKRRFINTKQQFFEGKFKLFLKRLATDGVARAEFKVCLRNAESCQKKTTVKSATLFRRDFNSTQTVSVLHRHSIKTYARYKGNTYIRFGMIIKNYAATHDEKQRKKQ